MSLNPDIRPPNPRAESVGVPLFQAPDSADVRYRKHFDTAHIKQNLKIHTMRGGLLTALAQAAKALLQVMATLVLVRLLTPDDFGLVGMVVAVTGFVALFKELGLSMATVQQEEISHAQVSTLFWLNVLFSAAMMMVAVLLAPPIAWFYGKPELIPVTLAISAGFIFSGLTVQHVSLLKRQMRFGAIAWMEMAGIVASGAAAVVVAAMGYRYWALVVQQLVNAMVVAICAWLVCDWRPGRLSWKSGVRSMVAFGGNLTGYSIVNYFSRNLDQVLIGRLFGAASLGFYQKAIEAITIPLKQLNEPLGNVAVPTLSRLVNESERYRKTYLGMLSMIIMITMPVAACFVAVPDWIIGVVLGKQWLAAAPLLAALGVSVLTQPIGHSTGWLFISQGRSREMLQWGFISGGTAIGSFLMGLPWGALGVALSFSLVGLLVRKPLLFWYVGRRGPVKMADFYMVSAPFLFTGLAVFAALVIFRVYLAPGIGMVEGLVAAIGISVVVATLALLAQARGREALGELSVLVRILVKNGLKVVGASGEGELLNRGVVCGMAGDVAEEGDGVVVVRGGSGPEEGMGSEGAAVVSVSDGIRVDMRNVG